MTVAETLGPAKLRDFYRCFILPEHIKKAKDNGNAERQQSLEAELKRRRKAIKFHELDAEYEAYVEAQRAKQAKWNAYASAVSGLAEDEPETEEMEAAHAEALKAREAFRAEYEPHLLKPGGKG